MLNQYMLASGDRVELVEAVGDFKAGDTGTVCGRASGSAGKGYIVAMDRTGGRPYFSAARLAKLQDDPLPPVPESVMYYNSTRAAFNTQHLIVQPHWELEGRLTVAVIKDGGHLFSSSEWGDALSVNLDPDSALQLAHDIRRMAMQIKRNQKQGGESK